MEWNNITNNNVYSLRGNHDIGHKLTDFDLLLELGLIKNVNQLDVQVARFHMFNYGEETRKILIENIEEYRDKACRSVRGKTAEIKKNAEKFEESLKKDLEEV